jgi:hypothetical protein
MNKYIINLLPALALVVGLSACGDESFTDSKVTPIVLMDMAGDATIEVALGATYQDPGCTATYMGKDYTAKMEVDGLDAVNTNVPGLYPINYSCTTPDGYTYEAQRVVAVCNPKVKYKAAGTFFTAAGTKRVDANGVEQTYAKSVVNVTQLASGLVKVDDLLGGYYQAMKATGQPTADAVTIQALLLMAEDGTFQPYSVKANGAPVQLDAFSNATFNAKKGVFTWTLTYKGDTYNIVLNR